MSRHLLSLVRIGRPRDAPSAAPCAAAPCLSMSPARRGRKRRRSRSGHARAELDAVASADELLHLPGAHRPTGQPAFEAALPVAREAHQRGRRADVGHLDLRRKSRVGPLTKWRPRRPRSSLPAVETTSHLSRLSRPRRIVLIVVLGSVCTIGPFSTDLYLPALPTVATDLAASSSSIALTVTTFLVGLALGQLLAGPLSDTYGRRLPLLVGLPVFTVASLVCALTPSAGVLVALRLVQGLAGASGMAIANAVVTDYSRGRHAARLLSRLALVSGLAPIIAPLVGAQLLRVTSWRGIFVVLTGLGIVLFSAVALGLRESLPREKRQAGGRRGRSAPWACSRATCGSWASRRPAPCRSSPSSPIWRPRHSCTRTSTGPPPSSSASCSR